MASTASKVPLFRTLAARGYASQPAVAAVGKSVDAQTTTLPNKLVVTSTETGSPVSRVSIAVRAGARNEAYDTQGASHLLRVAAGLSTKNATGFGITRNVQQIGGNLSVISDREIVAYTIEVTRNHLEKALQILENAVVGQVYKPWELADVVPRLKVDLANVTNEVRAVELLHRAAYRTGLGNSIFCPDYQVGKISSETLHHYYASNFTTNRVAIAGVNIDHQMLTGFAQSLAFESGDGPKNVCSYRGGADGRLEKGGRLASVAVATNSGSWVNTKEGLAFSVLQRAAGVAPSTKYGVTQGALTKIIQSAAPNTAAAALSAIYSDNGLFGFVATGPSKEIGAAVDAGVKALKSATITDEDVARGKAQLKSEIAFAYETDAELVLTLAGQSAILGSAYSLKGALDAVDAVSAADVKAAARKLSSEKMTVAAAGNLENVPFAADLN